MNRWQGANSALTFAVIGACVTGLSRYIQGQTATDPISLLVANWSLFSLWLFIVLLKIKFWLDDHSHFGEPAQDKKNLRIVGFVLAALSMVAFSIAGLLIATPDSAAQWLIVAILISTAWIAVHLMELTLLKKKSSEEVVTSLLRQKWVLFNVLYCLGLLVYIGLFDPLGGSLRAVAIPTLFLLLFLDWITARQIDKSTE